MNPNANTKEIIANCSIGNQLKRVILHKERGVSLYHIMIDKEYEGQVIYQSGWKVVPHEESWLNGKNCDEILQAVLNNENPNL